MSHIDKVLKAYFAYMSTQPPYAMAQSAEIIPSDMVDTSRTLEDDDEYLVWKPIPSTVNENQLQELEAFLGHPLPPSYRGFLQKLHFLEFYLDQNSLSFFPSFPGQLNSGFEDIINGYYDNLPPRGYLPFANYGDWGVACFDANVAAAGHEYPVVIFDHEDGYTKPLPYTNNFEEVFERAAHGYIWLGTPGWKKEDSNHR